MRANIMSDSQILTMLEFIGSEATYKFNESEYNE